jgi:ABC-type branched-subunit amino acid transport system ATPase component
VTAETATVVAALGVLGAAVASAVVWVAHARREAQRAQDEAASARRTAILATTEAERAKVLERAQAEQVEIDRAAASPSPEQAAADRLNHQHRAGR